VDGAITLISDLNYYYDYVQSLKQRQILPYFAALKEVGNLFLIDGKDAKALGSTLSDMARFRGVLNSEELLEFVQSRKDWLHVRREVERVMYGFGVDCIIT
jgi:recyclin-1